MKTLSISRKHDLIDRAKLHYHAKVYVPDKNEYISGLFCKPDGVTTYRNDQVEPVVNADGIYRLEADDAWLTVNRYNALVLNTRNMLIADIDFGDQRLNRFAGAEDCDEVLANLKDLHLLDSEHRFSDFDFASQSYRIYRTHSGCRVICTSAPVPWGYEAELLLRFLRSDSEYIKLCGIQDCYRARLTPKPWRQEDSAHVCALEAVHGDDEVDADLAEQLRLHDELTLAEDKWSSLA